MEYGNQSAATHPMYETLPLAVMEQQQYQSSSRTPSTDQPDIQTYVKEHLINPSGFSPDMIYATKVQGKGLSLDNPPTSASAKKIRCRRHKGRLSVREKKSLGLTTLLGRRRDSQTPGLTFASFTGLHVLWQEYIAQVLGDLNTPSAILAKCVKADFNGAWITVVAGKCPSLIGLSGIVLQDTEHAFILITPKDEVKTVLKQKTIFTFTIQKRLFTLYGDHFRARPSERITKKFKAKPTVDLC